MSRRAFTDSDRTLALNLLDRVRRTASANDDGKVLYNPQVLDTLKTSLGHKSLTLAFMRSQLGSLDKLQKALIDLVKHRLQAQNVHFPPLNVKNLSWCIPQSVEEEPAWRLLMEDPLLFSSEMLESLIALDEWTADTPSPPMKSNLLYIRTFQVPAVLFQEVLDELCEHGFDTHDRIHYWLRRIAEEPVDDTVYTLRYCGQTTGNPWERHRGDMYGRLQTFFGRFLKVLGQTAQGIKVLNQVKIYTLSGVFQQVPSDSADLREQILIGLFGDGTLNTQAGGKDVVTLFREDRDNFDRLKTQTTQLLMTETREYTDIEADALQQYSRAIHKYIGKNPSTVGSGHFTDQTEAMILRQATPSVLANGSAVMVTLASDLGEDHVTTEDTFWNAGGRSADAVTRIYNFFSTWEGPTALESINTGATRTMAAGGHLPLVDLFPWFTKDDKDYLKASELLRCYMNLAKPMIVLAYGERQIFAALESFKDFTASDFGSWKKMCRNYGRAAQYGHPYLCYFDGNDSDDHDPTTATVMIPSLHPGFLSRAGIVKEKATRVFVMTSAIAWCAMSTALTIARNGLPENREDYSKMIMATVDAMSGPDTTFGKAFASARREYDDCHQAYSEGTIKRRDAPKLQMPKGILEKKSTRAKKKSRYSTVTGHAEDGVGGWEVTFIKDTDPNTPQEFYTMTWSEDDGDEWKIAPIPLSKDIIPSDVDTKCSLYFVDEGLDIRGADGKSCGLRSPLASGRTKSITLPISAIFIAMGVKSLKLANGFIEHWEDLTGNSFTDEILSTHPHTSIDRSEGYIPAAFFGEARSGGGIPFPRSSITQKMFPRFIPKVRSALPAKPGDLLWLLEQFFLETFPTGGDLDPVSVSEHPTYSAYAKIMSFANRPKYQHHPHVNTLKAMAHLSEQGVDDRRVPWNIVLISLELLRPGSTSKKRNLKRTLPDGTKIETSRLVRTMNAGPAATTVVAPTTLPDLVGAAEGVGEVEDLTDDEDEVDQDDEDDEDNGDGVGDKEMEWNPSKGSKRKHNDDEDDQGVGSKGMYDSAAHKKRFGLRRTKAV